MNLYKITEQEKETLLASKMAERANYNPIQDINGEWFISEVEHQVCNLGTLAEFEPPEQENIFNQ